MEHRVILLDIEVQRDFFVRGGAFYKHSARGATANVYRLFDWAVSTGVPVLSGVLLVRPGERGSFGPKPHCLDGSTGSQKLARSVLRSHINLGLSHTADVPYRVFDDYQQVIFETRHTDVFRHQKAERLITELSPRARFVVCGAGIAQGIRQAVIGLRSRGHDVILAEDAVVTANESLAEMAWLQMMAKGARPLPTAQIVREFAPARRTRRASKTVEI